MSKISNMIADEDFIQELTGVSDGSNKEESYQFVKDEESLKEDEEDQNDGIDAQYGSEIDEEQE